MYIHALGQYLPSELVPNEYFLEVNGLTDSWIYERTGIKTRTKAASNENTNTMAVEAVRNLLKKSNTSLEDVDLIVGASYSPYDTVGTIAHVVQREFNIVNAQALFVSSACSSFVNAVEVVQGYFALNKAKKALVIASEHNTAYSNESCEKSGHLWGDGAGAILITKDQVTEGDPKIIDIYTKALGHIGKGPEGVYLLPGNGGLEMPFGKDVFIYACKYMKEALETVLERNNLGLENLDYIVPHQANVRIMKNLAKQIDFHLEKVISNIEELGNTGCASTVIGLNSCQNDVPTDSLVGLTVFGGGYSAGSMLIQF